MVESANVSFTNIIINFTILLATLVVKYSISFFLFLYSVWMILFGLKFVKFHSIIERAVVNKYIFFITNFYPTAHSLIHYPLSMNTGSTQYALHQFFFYFLQFENSFSPSVILILTKESRDEIICD